MLVRSGQSPARVMAVDGFAESGLRAVHGERLRIWKPVPEARSTASRRVATTLLGLSTRTPVGSRSLNAVENPAHRRCVDPLRWLTSSFEVRKWSDELPSCWGYLVPADAR